MMNGKITIRPIRLLYVVVVTVVSVVVLGWEVLLPLFLLALDIELR